MILRVHEKPDEGSLTILRPALLINWEFFPNLIFFSFKQDGYFRIRRFRSSNESRS